MSISLREENDDFKEVTLDSLTVVTFAKIICICAPTETDMHVEER